MTIIIKTIHTADGIKAIFLVSRFLLYNLLRKNLDRYIEKKRKNGMASQSVDNNAVPSSAQDQQPNLPTLLKVGSIIPQKWMTSEQKKKCQAVRAIDWIMEYINDRSWFKRKKPRIKIRGPGSRVGVFRSGTGTGKSTVFPPAIFKEYFETRGIRRTILCTQPTVATATDIPYQIAMYNKNLIMGQTIGYQTGNLIRKPNMGVLFATIGILLQHLKLLTDDEFMHKYQFIIIDEIHNRSIETDTVLFYLRKFLERNYEDPDCPYIILTSGTFEPEIFMNYFDCPADSFLDIAGSSFPIKDHYAAFTPTNYINYTVDLVEKIHVDGISDIQENRLFRDILVFAAGGGQINDIIDKLHRLNSEVFSKGLEYSIKHSAEQQKKYVTGGAVKKKEYYLCPIAVTSDNMQKGSTEYQNVFSDINTIVVPIYKFDGAERTDKIIAKVPAGRRVMVATNAIETGITIDTLKYCIDTGYVNESQFNPNFGITALINKNVTQASARQRRGRVGRKDPGEFYTAYTLETYSALTPLPFPDIVKVDMTSMLLDLIIGETETKLIEINHDEVKKYPDAFQMNQFDQRWYTMYSEKPFIAKTLNFIQYPAADSLTYAFEKLHVLGLIDHTACVTLFGWYASKFRKVSVENARMILAGYHTGANVLDLITIACFISAGHKLGIKRNKYVPRNPIGVSASESIVYANVIIADEFIEYLFIWNDLMDFIGELVDDISTITKKADPIKSASSKVREKTHLVDRVYEWAEKNSFDADVLLGIITTRDELIIDLLNIGLNPFYNGLSLDRGTYSLNKILKNNLVEGLEEIKKLKMCILEGYRLNQYVWNESKKEYTNVFRHNPVALNSKLVKAVAKNVDGTIEQQRPTRIIVGKVMLRPSMKDKSLYEFSGSDVSVLDGYLDIDVDFTMK